MDQQLNDMYARMNCVSHGYTAVEQKQIPIRPNEHAVSDNRLEEYKTVKSLLYTMDMHRRHSSELTSHADLETCKISADESKEL